MIFILYFWLFNQDCDLVKHVFFLWWEWACVHVHLSDVLRIYSSLGCSLCTCIDVSCSIRCVDEDDVIEARDGWRGSVVLSEQTVCLFSLL